MLKYYLHYVLQASKATIVACQTVNTVNKVLIPVSVAFELYRLGKSVFADYKNKTTRNFTETVTSMGAGYAGGYGGAKTAL